MTAVQDNPRTVHVEHCMGTVFSIDVRDAGNWQEAVHDVVAWLHRVDDVFSSYQDSSDISRLRRARLDVAQADEHVAEVLDLCVQVQRETGGYFSPLWNGALDPTGLVKGWAIERAEEIIRDHGSRNHAVSGGGDMQVAGESAPGKPWRVGITDPADRTRVLTVVEGRDFAVATSGVGERGEHILNPFTGRPPAGVTGVTVVGRSLTRVDAYATAAFAMGNAAVDWLESQPGYEGLVVAEDGTTRSTSGFVGMLGS
jgi:thiamine biosynthesis lipoprotein